MLVALVYVHIKPEYLEAFKEATLENARNSVQEPGVARFDVIQQEDDPTRFVLVEVYRDAEAPARHKETAHYAKWRSVAEEMMAEPRSGVRYQSLFPADEGW
jgi:(4S)-4-hydroxy-5-phosphonooxypentane-2,3-dione isomerase